MADRGAGLLLLREADVVRHSGLAAAAQALDLVRAGAISQCARLGPRLTARVREKANEEHAPWVECNGDASRATFAWGCTCPLGLSAQGQSSASGTGRQFACVHVAALMTQWVRQPASFRDEYASVAHSPPISVPLAATRSTHSASGGTPVPETRASGATTLRDKLDLLSPGALQNARRAVLGEATDEAEDDAAVRAALYQALTDPVLLAAVCARLDANALLLLRGVHYHGGVLTESAMAALGERAGLTHATQIVARHALRSSCLLFPIGGDEAPAGWAIPPEIQSTLDIGLGLQALDVPASPPRKASHTTGSSADSNLRRTCLTLTLMAATQSQLRARRPATPVANTCVLPREADEPTAEALDTWARAACVDGALARFCHRVLQAALRRSGAQHPVLALDRLPPSEWARALRLTTQAWLDAGGYAELCALGSARRDVRVRCDRRHSAFSVDAIAAENAAARKRIVQLIAEAQPGTWHLVDDFAALVWRLDPWFLRGRQRAFESPAWWIAEAVSGRPLRPEVESEWMRAEGLYIRELVGGPLRWLGVVEIVSDSDGSAREVRLTEWARYLLGRIADPPAAYTRLAEGWDPALRPLGHSGLSVQPLALAPGGTARLTAWGNVSEVRGGRLVWQLSPDRFCRNLDAARGPVELASWLDSLDTRDGTGCAAHLAPTLARWQERYGASRLERDVVIVEAHDEPGLREALAAIPAFVADARHIAPGVAALPRHLAKELEHLLAERGYLV